jgi:hypothetical protein
MVAYQPEMSDQGAKTFPTSERRDFNDYASKATSGFNVGVHCRRNFNKIFRRERRLRLHIENAMRGI